jgi:AraC-like DNA-binding protein
MVYFVRAASLTNYVDVARALQLDPYRLLREARIERAALLDPDLRIPAEAVARLLEASAAAAQADDFGLRMAQSRLLSNLGPLGLIVREQPTLRQALDAVARHLRIQNEAISLGIEESNGIVTIREDVVGRAMGAIRQGTELSLGVLYRTLHTLFGASWKPLTVCFSHDAPSELAPYRRFFAVPVAFGSEFDGIICKASDLDLPMPNADPQMAKYIDQYIASITGDEDADLRDKVAQLVHVLLPSGRCTADAVAHNLGVDRRTVHRYLRRSGETFSTLVDAARAELAVRYLLSRKRSATDIALMLGFSAPSAFSRWFSGHFGCSVSAWRKQHAR